MTRIPRLTPDQLDAAQHAVYAEIAGGPRAQRSAFPLTDDTGALHGPFNAMLLHPPLGDALQRLGAAIRYQGRFSQRAREIAVLLVAADADSAFERYAHERVAVQTGLSDELITSLRPGTAPELTDAEESAVAIAARHILDHHTLTDTEYADAVAALGPEKIFELTTLIGYYQLLALQLRVFDADQAPVGEPAPGARRNMLE